MTSPRAASASAARPPLSFRVATPADVGPLVALIESAYRGEASRAGWTTEADLLDGRRTGPEDVAACIERDHSIILVGEGQAATGDTPPLLACAHLAIEDDAAYFGMFSVRPELQGGGVGKALLAEAERIARDRWRLPSMRMTVIDVRDELIAFYERRGYRRTGIHKPFPYGDERFGIPRRSDLRFEMLEKSLAPPARPGPAA
ncbi:MAG: GNAT family N-acetyltransferase [Pseudomonadota bacterium]|nr:GNAT family N-acetyltransferase [Pseudomonadota bacterium]